MSARRVTNRQLRGRAATAPAQDPGDSPTREIALSRVAAWRARTRATTRAMLLGLVPRRSAIALADSDLQMSDAHFEQAVCRNCGEPREQPFCGACGQGVVARLSLRDLFQEFWQRSRAFESATVHAALNLFHSPGRVAREYVLGARKRHMHPLKLLLVAVATLVLLLAETRYLTAGQDDLGPQMLLVVRWARWSFTLGLFAIVIATITAFPRRLGLNLVEHLTLAAYVQFVILAVNIANLLPLLVLDITRWVPAWRAAAGWYMWPIESAILALALMQFFRLRLPRDLGRLVLAIAVFVLAKKALLLGYGHLIARVVLHAAD